MRRSSWSRSPSFCHCQRSVGCGLESGARLAQGAAAARGIGVLHATHEPRAARVGALAADHLGRIPSRRLLDAQIEGFGCKEAPRGRSRELRGIVPGAQLPQEERPGQRRGALELQGRRPAQAGRTPAAEDKAGLVETPAPGAPDHLEQFVRLDLMLLLVEAVGSRRDEHGPEREIDSRAQAQRGDHRPELPRLRQRLDHARALAVGQPAVMVGDAKLDQFRELWTQCVFLFRRQRQGIRQGQLARQLARQSFRVLPVRRKDENGAQALPQSAGDAPAPESLDAPWQTVNQVVGIDLFKRDRPLAVLNDLRLPPQPHQPGSDILRIRNIAAEQEHLRVEAQRKEQPLVMITPVRIGQPLVLVDHQKLEGCARPGSHARPRLRHARLEKALHSLERRDNDRRVRRDRHIPGGDPDLPAARPPFGELVVRQRPGWHRVKRAPRKVGLLNPPLKDIRLSGTGGRVNDHVLPSFESLDRLRLPTIGKHQPLQSLKRVDMHEATLRCTMPSSTVPIQWLN